MRHLDNEVEAILRLQTNVLLPDTKQHCCFKQAMLKYIGGMSVSGFQLVGIGIIISRILR